MNNIFYVNHLNELNEVARSLVHIFGNQKKIVLFGDIGVGKTSLIKSICKILKVKDNVSSPSFSIVNEYINDDNTPIYHFDFFRLSTEAEAYDIGYEEYLNTDSFCFIEWPEKILHLLPEERINLSITNDKGKRIIKIIS